MRAQGIIELFDVKTGNSKATNQEKSEEGVPNETLALDYAPDGSTYASAGKDKVIRVYDDRPSKLTVSITGSTAGDEGHANRIMAAKYRNPHEIWSAMVHTDYFGTAVPGGGIAIGSKKT